MDVLCTDKTGTLTEDRVVLERYCDVALHDSEPVLSLAYTNSHFQTGLGAAGVDARALEVHKVPADDGAKPRQRANMTQRALGSLTCRWRRRSYTQT